MWQLYDLAGLYYRAFYALPSSITGPHGRPTGAIRGTLDMLARVIADGRPTRAAACLDIDWRPAWRVALIPAYKAHRVAAAASGMTKTAGRADSAAPEPWGDSAGPLRLFDWPGTEDVPEGLAWQVPVILELLDAVGIAVAGAAECEADDVIATLCDTEWSDAVEVVSGDRDLFQLIRDAPSPVTVRYVGGGMAGASLIDTRLLREKYGVDGAGYAAMATLRGDPSDGLIGVAGIGEKTAAKLVTQFGTVAAILDAAADPDSAMPATQRRRITDAGDYLRAATRVVAPRREAVVEMSTPLGSDGLPRAPHDPGRLADLANRHGVGRQVEHLLAALSAAAG